MCPTSDPIPVVVTRISPWPRVTLVFMKAMPTRSPSGHVRPGDCRRALLDGHALAGQRAFLDLQRRRHDHPSVGGHPVTRVDDDDIARDDLVGGHLHDLAVTTDLGDRLHHRAERRRRRLGLAFLVVARATR